MVSSVIISAKVFSRKKKRGEMNDVFGVWVHRSNSEDGDKMK